MHIQWITTLVTETSCVIYCERLLGLLDTLEETWTKNNKKKSNLNLLFSFKVSKV